MKLTGIPFLLVALLLTGCQDVIEMDLPEGETYLVVDGSINDVSGATLTLSTSAGYFEQGETPKINNASVSLFENGVLVSTLERVDTADGRYASEFVGEIGKSYYVEIRISSDEPNFRESTWRSTSSELRRVFEIDSMKARYLDRTTNPQAFREGIYAVAYFREPPGLGDRYRFSRWLGDSLFTRSITLLTDIGVDGQYFGDPNGFGGLQIYGPMEPEDSVSIRVASITSDHFEYLSLLGEQVFQVGSTFDPPPAPLYGNIYNVDDEDELGFGYFGASAVSRASTVYNP